MSEAEILADFPELTKDDLQACYAYAADKERRMTAGRPAAAYPSSASAASAWAWVSSP
jgi:hypothetical protein